MAKQFVPIEEECRGLGVVMSQPVKWYVLIKEMEEFRERAGWGLGNSWSFVHKEDYTGARAAFDDLKTWLGNAKRRTR